MRIEMAPEEKYQMYQAFLADIKKDRQDITAISVLADWLSDIGEDDFSEYIHTHLQRYFRGTERTEQERNRISYLRCRLDKTQWFSNTIETRVLLDGIDYATGLLWNPGGSLESIMNFLPRLIAFHPVTSIFVSDKTPACFDPGGLNEHWSFAVKSSVWSENCSYIVKLASVPEEIFKLLEVSELWRVDAGWESSSFKDYKTEKEAIKALAKAVRQFCWDRRTLIWNDTAK